MKSKNGKLHWFWSGVIAISVYLAIAFTSNRLQHPGMSEIELLLHFEDVITWSN